jgi:hypothetical protein
VAWPAELQTVRHSHGLTTTPPGISHPTQPADAAIQCFKPDGYRVPLVIRNMITVGQFIEHTQFRTVALKAKSRMPTCTAGSHCLEWIPNSTPNSGLVIAAAAIPFKYRLVLTTTPHDVTGALLLMASVTASSLLNNIVNAVHIGDEAGWP